jgi:hypothetical protein
MIFGFVETSAGVRAWMPGPPACSALIQPIPPGREGFHSLLRGAPLRQQVGV